MQPPTREVVAVVTGANSGVGFGICQRLLHDLSLDVPDSSSPFARPDRLTIVLACRSAQRAENARSQLLALHKLPSVSPKRRKLEVKLDFLELDLTSMQSVFRFSEEAAQRYPFITHLFLNAGMVSVYGFDWFMVAKQCLMEPIAAVTTPRFIRQRIGEQSRDELGLVWQANVFGHYALFRSLEKLLRANPYKDARVVWMTSVDSPPSTYSSSDIQLIRTRFSYEASKYELDLLVSTLAMKNDAEKKDDNSASITHVLSHPGICSTNMTASVMGFVLEFLKMLTFYLARIFGSLNHPILPYNGAISAIHAGFAPTSTLPPPPVKLGSRSSRFGRIYVGKDVIEDWEVDKGEPIKAVCESLYSKYANSHGSEPSDSGVEFTSQ